MKTALLFLATFALGAALALGTRTVLHNPHATASVPGSADSQSASVHTNHSHSAPATPPAAPASAKPVNTVCPICAMEVDPSLPTATYQGKQVGFGCAACPPRFAKDPERWGPFALRNDVAP